MENEDDNHHRDAEENEEKDYEVAEVVAAQLGTVAELGSVNGFGELLAVLLNNADGLRKFTVPSAEGLLFAGTEGKRVLALAAWPLGAAPLGDGRGASTGGRVGERTGAASRMTALALAPARPVTA